MKKVITIVCFLFGLTSLSMGQNGLYFDGVDDYVQTNYSGVTGSANRTFEAWVYVPSTAPSSNLSVLDYGINAAGSRNTFFVSGTRELRFISGGTNANISTPQNSVPLDQWVHVAFVLDNGVGYLYINGTQMGTGSLTSVNTPSGNQDVKIGQRVTGGSIPFTGIIDEVRVWSSARTLTDIQTNMNSGICIQDPNLELYLQFEEGVAGGSNTAVTVTADASGNGYTGTLTNFALSGTTSNWVTGSAVTSGLSTAYVQQIACTSFSLTPTSTVYTTSGIYTETVGTNASGCDSIVTLDLLITNNSNTGIDVQSACDSYTWIDGNTYTASNDTATYTLTNIQGCDSVVTLNLDIYYSSSSTDVQTACGSYTWIDGNTYTASNNTATYTLTNYAGCDSVITLDLTIDVVNTSVTQNNEELTADQMGATYQWVECPAMTPISGETNQTFTATANGDYAVIITNNQCSDTSICYSVTTVGTIENQFGTALQIFPNPTYGQFSIDMGETYKMTTITIMDLSGKVVLSNIYNNRQVLNVELNKPSGVYLLMIEAEDKKAVVQLIKH